MRRLLKARELGLPEGDTSTVEKPRTAATQRGADRDRPRPGATRCCPTWCGCAASRRSARSCTAQRRSAASCTSTSARRPWPSDRCAHCADDDSVVATYREHGHALLRGVPHGVDHGRDVRQDSRAAAAAAAARCTCSTRRTRFYGGNAIVAGGLPLAVGLALADTMLDHNRVTACFFGDGAVAEGEFHESVNLAALWQLPVLFCCENNLYAMGTALDRAQSQTDLAAKAAAYGCRRARSTGWTCSPCHNAAQRRRGPRPRRRRPVLPRVPHLPLPRALDVRPGAATATRPRSSEWTQARSRSTPSVSGACTTAPLTADEIAAIERRRRCRSATRRSRSPRPERGRTSPTSTRDVLTPAATARAG